jgi:hypothetical protein
MMMLCLRSHHHGKATVYHVLRLVLSPTLVSSTNLFLESANSHPILCAVKISAIPGDEDEAFKYFAKLVVPTAGDGNRGKNGSAEEAEAACSFRAMTMLKEDLVSSSVYGHSPVLIKNPAQAALLAKDLFAGLSVGERQRYSTLHIRELLDALLEAFPEKVMAAASAGGKRGIEEHLGPLISSDQTLSVLTHLVCYGCTGRKGIASAEKSAQHTANMYQSLQRNGGKSKIGMGHRKKFVRACMDFQLLDRLADALTTPTATTNCSLDDSGEEVCEAILTMIELIGYPPDDNAEQHQQNEQSKGSKNEIVVGEDVLLSPLASKEWWSKLLMALEEPTTTPEQRLAIARTCTQAFSLATGNSSRICKSHAPATDATEQSSEKIVQETEEHLTNRLIEWGLTDRIHAVLVLLLPLLIRGLRLPYHDILTYEGTFATGTRELAETVDVSIIVKHPGRYGTLPLGSWRLQFLSLLKEIVVYRGSGESSKTTAKAMDAIMELPLPTEFVQNKNAGEDEKEMEEYDSVAHNPWPALCSFVWAYPYNDFYGIVFFELLRAVVVEHHEATLRVILQKSKFLTRAVKTLATKRAPQQGLLLNCLNMLRLRSLSLPPGAFLPQYLGSHDLWKGFAGQLAEYVLDLSSARLPDQCLMDTHSFFVLSYRMTFMQQTPIKGHLEAVNIGLGSKYATKLGLGDIVEFDSSTVTSTAAQENEEVGESGTLDDCKNSDGKKKKKTSKKKKKK